MITAKMLLKSQENNVWSISPDNTVFEAIKEMENRGVGALLVMQSEKLIGIISERDYTRKIILNDLSSKDTKVSAIMVTNVICVKDSDAIEDCMRLMYKHNFRHLPVLEGETVIGMLSIKDVLGGLLHEKEDLIHQLENYINS